MAESTIKVEGLAQAVRTLRKLGVEAADLKDVFTRIGAEATAAVRTNTPVATGSLQATVKQSRRQNSVYIYAGSKKVFYGPFVEYGTKYQSAQHFMRDAGRKQAPKALHELEREMQRIIAKLGLDR